MLKLAVLAFAPAVAVAGCINYPGPADLATTPAPALQNVKAEIDKSTCGYFDNQFSYGGPKENEKRPAPISGCNAYFPRHLVNAAIQGSCASMFDLDEAGQVVNLQTRCNVASPRVPLPGDWARLAEGALTYSVERQLASWRYPRRGAEAPGQRRHSIYVGTGFGITEEDFAPVSAVPFQRPEPAPPLPADLVEKAREIETQTKH